MTIGVGSGDGPALDLELDATLYIGDDAVGPRSYFAARPAFRRDARSSGSAEGNRYPLAGHPAPGNRHSVNGQ